MNKVKKIIQCLKYRRIILGKIGKNNHFRPGCTMTSAAKVGNYNYFGDRCMIGNAQIGNYCSFAPDVKIGQSQHSVNYFTTFQKISKRNIKFTLNSIPAVIENDVWLGANVVVMQGVKIGNGAVVGANAVVTRDIPEYAIAVGVPAKVIRYRFEGKVIQILNRTKWWNKPLDEACLILKELEQK